MRSVSSRAFAFHLRSLVPWTDTNRLWGAHMAWKAVVMVVVMVGGQRRK